ncbi:sensor histidine kinase [Nonomuraea rhodomycinica]|uniref:sensor histidine kinase n=1 Tax=Nonomuraea rhodomycinica TaxID=1712872 RepID=UPI0028B1D8F0|nr:sensor histidine kinase [Nonomuraea rhodomycinica]
MRTLLAWCGVAALVPPLYAATLTDGENLLPAGAPHVAFAAAMAVPLAWARRRPGVVLTVLLSGAVAAMVLGQPAQRFWPLFPAADVLVCLLAAGRSRRAGLAAAAGALLVQETAFQVDLARHGLRAGALGFLALSVLLGLGVLVAWLTGFLVRQRRAYDLALRAHVEARTVTEERLRIARELHDMVAHSIGVIAIQAGAGARVIDDSPERAREALAAIEATSRQTLKGLRHLLGVLRAPGHPGPAGRGHPGPSEGGRRGSAEGGQRGEPASPPGLDELDRLARTTAAAGLRVDVRRRGKPRPLPAAVDRSAFRIIQESVTNVLRHAGTDHCRVVVDYGEDDLRVEVVDDGPATAGPGPRPAARPAVRPAAAPEAGGHGITGMRERAALLDGDLEAGPRPGGGFRVTARLPLAPGGLGQNAFFRNGSSASAVRPGNSDIG